MDFYRNDATFDSRRAQRTLNWRPRVDLPEGFAATRASDQPPRATSSRIGAMAIATLSLCCDLDSFA
jgi:hypothetical protein